MASTDKIKLADVFNPKMLSHEDAVSTLSVANGVSSLPKKTCLHEIKKKVERDDVQSEAANQAQIQPELLFLACLNPSQIQYNLISKELGVY